MTIDSHQAADLLLAIEAEMRRIALWEASPPDPAALASRMPFCYDTLAFHQWLQWVFLPRMRQVVESDQGWPANSDIHPLAEYSFQRLEADTDELLALVKEFDRFIGRRSGGV